MSQLMTADEGYALSQYQRPGRIIVMGATMAREEHEPATDDLPIWRKNRLGVRPVNEYPRWQGSWWRLDLYRRTGLDPSIWAATFGLLAQKLTGVMPTDEEWAFLCNRNLSLAEAQAWLLSKCSKEPAQ